MGDRGWSRIGAVAVLAGLVVFGLTSVALGSTVALYTSGSNASVEFIAGAEDDNVTVTRSGPSLVISDPPSTITPLNAGCTVNMAGNVAACTPGAGVVITAASYQLGLGSPDRLTLALAGAAQGRIMESTVSGMGGRDVINGSSGKRAVDDLAGGSGDDTLNGRAGNDRLQDYDPDEGSGTEGGANHLNGGAGQDELYGGPNKDTINGGAGNDFFGADVGVNKLSGGPGFDEIDFRGLDFFGIMNPFATSGIGVNVDLGKGRARDTKPGVILSDRLSGIEDVDGTSAADRIVGTKGANYLYGGGGSDVLIGRKGSDLLYGGRGNDVIKAKDGARDRVSCGGDRHDRARTDRKDEVRGC